jgi:hypothetical protein
MKRSSMCSISANVSAPCSKCGKKQEKSYPWPVHIVGAPGVSFRLYMCADCCPEHGRPPLLDGALKDV